MKEKNLNIAFCNHAEPHHCETSVNDTGRTSFETKPDKVSDNEII